ncbi:MAG: TIGR04211 family SH3 domain-containing protein [Desulfatiglandaceae bacterium]|jgi:SH3 domain protein
MKTVGFIVMLILGSLLLSESSWATRAYVTDSFEITLRTGPSSQNKVIAMPASGEAVEILNTQDDWSNVRLLGRQGGAVEGWVLSRYLISRLPWEIQARTFKDENTRIKEKLEQIERDQKDSTSREQELAGELKKNVDALKKLKEEYDSLKRGAANYLKLKKDYDAAVTKLETSEKTAQSLTKENERLRYSQRNKWFATGALVLLVGLIIGLVLGRKEKKRKSLYY